MTISVCKNKYKLKWPFIIFRKYDFKVAERSMKPVLGYSLACFLLFATIYFSSLSYDSAGLRRASIGPLKNSYKA